MTDRENVIKGLMDVFQNDIGVFIAGRIEIEQARNFLQTIDDAIALLKEQEGIINELLDLGYPHNFQREAPWVVDYLYKLTEIIKKAFKAREGR